MNSAKFDLVRQWLIKSRRDLAAAEKLASGEDYYHDIAVYHCQQAAEKALKGFLAFHDQRLEKTHDRSVLVEQAALIEPGFVQWLDAADHLTPYATAFRYPGESTDLTWEEFQAAWQAAENICGFVLSRLPKEVQP